MKLAPSHDDISQRAFEICQARGSLPGRDQEDWFQAEQELLSWDGMNPPHSNSNSHSNSHSHSAVRDEADIEALDLTSSFSVPPPRRPRAS